MFYLDNGDGTYTIYIHNAQDSNCDNGVTNAVVYRLTYSSMVAVSRIELLF